MEHNDRRDSDTTEPTDVTWTEQDFSQTIQYGAQEGCYDTTNYPTSPSEGTLAANSSRTNYPYLSMISPDTLPPSPGVYQEQTNHASWGYSSYYPSASAGKSNDWSLNQQTQGFVHDYPHISIDTSGYPSEASNDPPTSSTSESSWNSAISPIPNTTNQFHTSLTNEEPMGVPSSMPATPQIPRTQNMLAQRAKEFRELPSRAVTAIPRGPFLPQRMYRPHTNADKERYVNNVNLQDVIVFESASHYEWGIYLADAFSGRNRVLKDPEDHMFEGLGPSVSIRLEWPGYGSWSRQIPTRDFKSPPCPITRQKLAKNVAKIIKRFMEESVSRQIDEDAEPDWRVGDVRFEELMLVSLHHVSMGSWQPHIRLRTPRHSRVRSH